MRSSKDEAIHSLPSKTTETTITSKEKGPQHYGCRCHSNRKAHPEEQQRCFDNNLCFKCQKPRHISSKCQNPFLGKQRQPTTTTAKIEKIPNNENSTTVGRISTMDFQKGEPPRCKGPLKHVKLTM